MVHRSLEAFDKATAPGGPAWMRTAGLGILLVWAALLANKDEMVVQSDPAYRGMALLFDDNGWLIITGGLFMFTFLAIIRETAWLAAVSLIALTAFEAVIWFLIMTQAPTRVIAWMHLVLAVLTAAAFIRQVMLNVSRRQIQILEAKYQEHEARRSDG